MSRHKKNYSMTGKRTPRCLRWYLDNDHVVPIDLYTAFRDNFIKAVVDNPEGVTLPLNLGMIKIMHSKPRSTKGLTIATGKRLGGIKEKFLNYETNGSIFKAVWYSIVTGASEEVRKKAFRNSEIYSFTPSLRLRRAMFDKIRANEWHDYHTRAYKVALGVQAKRGRPRKVTQPPPVEQAV